MGIEKIMMRKEDANEDDYVGYEADDEGKNDRPGDDGTLRSV